MNDDAKLEALAKRLGTAAAERLDVDAVARNVVAELRQAPPRRRPWIEVHWLRIAAAFLVLLGGGVVVRQMLPVQQTSKHTSHFVADDLGDLSTDELRDVLVQFDQMVGSDRVVADSSDMRELDAQQLRAVLRTLEG